MPMKRICLMVLIMTEWIAAFTPAVARPDVLAMAEQNASAWLALVDAKQYGHSWDQAAVNFQIALSRDRWIQSLDAARKSLGKVKSRNTRHASRHRELPGAPDGEYIQFIYDTTFDFKASATETLTLIKTDTGAWKVVGYHIQ